MKKACVFFLALASMTNATDTTIHCGQKGFQVSAQFGWSQTSASKNMRKFDELYNSSIMATTDATGIVQLPPLSSQLDIVYIAGINILALDYKNHLSKFQSTSSVAAGLNLGYKWILNCNQYSVTPNAFILYDATTMCAPLKAIQMGAVATRTYRNNTKITSNLGSSTQNAGDVQLTNSGPVLGFNVLLAKEFNWGNAGLLLGMKFKSYQLNFMTTKSETIKNPKGFILSDGFMDVSFREDAYPTSELSSLKIEDCIETDKINKMVNGLTIGLSTNYYVSDNLSAGFTLFYDMYAPVTFELANIPISPYSISGESQKTTNGSIKLQHNTIGFMMNLTYSFG